MKLETSIITHEVCPSADVSHAIVMQSVPKFFFHRMMFGEVQYDLGLEDPHRDCIEQQFLTDGENGSLLEARSAKCPLANGVHQYVCRGIDEDAQPVGHEGVAGESVAIHSLLELAYEQLVTSAPAIVLLVEVLLADVPDVGHDEPDVEFSLLRVFGLDHDTLWQEPCASLVLFSSLLCPKNGTI